MKLKTKLLIIAIIILTISVSSLIFVIFKPYYFIVENINITGNSYLTESEVVNSSTIRHGESIILLSIKDIEERLNNLSWVYNSDVKKVWPNNISIMIEERKPLLALSYHGSFVIIDTKGVCLDIRANFAEVNLPIISGYIPDDVTAGDRIMSEESWTRVTKVTNNLPQSIFLQLSEISFYGNEVRIFLNNGLEIYLGDIIEFEEDKLLLLPEIIESIEDVKKGYLDLSGIYTVFRSFIN
jgi:cell division protein FtsQ